MRPQNKVDPLAQQVEHNTFNVGVLGSSPKRITLREAPPLFFYWGSHPRVLSIASLLYYVFWQFFEKKLCDITDYPYLRTVKLMKSDSIGTQKLLFVCCAVLSILVCPSRVVATETGDGGLVYYCTSGTDKYYHSKRSCTGFANCMGVIQPLTPSTARIKGLSPCPTCIGGESQARAAAPMPTTASESNDVGQQVANIRQQAEDIKMQAKERKQAIKDAKKAAKEAKATAREAKAEARRQRKEASRMKREAIYSIRQEAEDLKVSAAERRLEAEEMKREAEELRREAAAKRKSIAAEKRRIETEQRRAANEYQRQMTQQKLEAIRMQREAEAIKRDIKAQKKAAKEARKAAKQRIKEAKRARRNR